MPITSPLNATAHAARAPFGWVPATLALILVLAAGLPAAAAPSAYVANSASNNVSVIDTATNTVVTIVFVGADAHGVAVTPDGTRVYVTLEGSASVAVIDTATTRSWPRCPWGPSRSAWQRRPAWST